ncbi:MAG: aromatic-ring-hydroxylating dioxygenase subunit beta [Beijerinckiaceae bacterium]|nr:aromatic-ring-hydroxylating dioxygenase subunit beta [Beijerinckiaceae bacterium]
MTGNTQAPDFQTLYFKISRALADYARCIDDDRLEEWPSFFVEDCLYKVTTADNHREGLEAGVIFANSRGMLSDRISALRQANIYERQSYRHLIGPPSILSFDSDGVRSESAFMVARIMRDGTTSLFATGRYLDSWRDADDVLRLKERIVVCDSSRIDTLMAIPL